MDNERHEVARINVTVVEYGKGTKKFNICQRYKDASLIWTERMHYKEPVDKEVIVTDCSFEDYYDQIFSFLDNNLGGLSDNIQSNNRAQKGFYLIDQALRECLTDLSNYWKNNVLPYVNEENNIK